MGFFERKLKPGMSLVGIPTDRLLREYERASGGIAFFTQANAAAEFATPENPAVIDSSKMLSSLNDMILSNEIKAELERRGFKPTG